jgi:predicted secreted protein
MRRTAIALLAFTAAASSACAGDFADREIIGFSPDGSRFAFEEYGVEDGSGFPYSNTYVIDTASDSWIDGTPIRLRNEDESRRLGDLRVEARRKAADILERQNIHERGVIVASNPVTETSADPHRVAFHPRLIVPPSSGATMVLQISEAAMPAENCPPEMGPYKGFNLILSGSQGSVAIHSDSGIPPSRRCPTGYAISDVVTFYPEGGAPVMAVLVNNYSLGFEGPNRRFLAVTARFKE